MKIKIQKIGAFLKKLPKTLASHPFLAFWVVLIVSLILGGFVFYKYVILVQKIGIREYQRPLRFNQSVYQEVLDSWEERAKNFEEADFRKYPNPFLESEKISLSTSTSEATSTKEATSSEEVATSTPANITPSLKTKELLAAANLSWFYRIKGEKLPSVKERAKIWEQKGLGLEEEYKGLKHQNEILLAKLKKELTE